MKEVRMEQTEEQDLYGILFREKLQAELSGFLRRMLKKSKGELIQNAYKISAYRDIYQIMEEQSYSMDKTCLRRMIVFPGLLGYLFCRWLKQEDSVTEELENCLKTAVMELENGTVEIQEGNGAA